MQIKIIFYINVIYDFILIELNYIQYKHNIRHK